MGCNWLFTFLWIGALVAAIIHYKQSKEDGWMHISEPDDYIPVGLILLIIMISWPIVTSALFIGWLSKKIQRNS